ncbi:MAG: helix-turn-helix domain-containing protein, partial [Synergistaceae bacterium]
YLIHYEIVDDAIDEDSETETSNVQTDKTLTHEQIEEKLQDWISAKGYLQPKINMGEIAQQIGSNRSYLSGFINTQYGCTYYKWIALLRLQEAKKLLIDRPELTIPEIAERAGFSSNTHFTTLFAKEEELPPAQWREKHIGV